ncbi:MAG: LamG-like jellyroll fold domain-containing protein, partial [Bacilli bacterium]
LAFDIFGLSHLNMSSSSRIINESGNNNFSVMAEDNGVLVDFLRPFYYKNISLSFWRKSDFTKLDSDFSINLLADDQKILGFDLSHNNLYYYFNNFNFKINFDNISTLLSDNLWHQYILVYDAYNLRLKLYIDGQLVAYWNKNWLNPIPIDSLNIYSQGENSIIDELGIWNGTLKEEEIEYLYEKQKDFYQN